MEMSAEHRSALLALAARRGEKGFSSVLNEAIDQYLRGETDREQRRKLLLSLAGSFSQKEADELRRETSALREHWR